MVGDKTKVTITAVSRKYKVFMKFLESACDYKVDNLISLWRTALQSDMCALYIFIEDTFRSSKFRVLDLNRAIKKSSNKRAKQMAKRELVLEQLVAAGLLQRRKQYSLNKSNFNLL